MADVEVFEDRWEDILPGLEAAGRRFDAVVTDPPFLTGASGVSSHCPDTGVGRRYDRSESVGLPWGYSLDWVDACAAFSPAHWVVFANFKMLGGLCAALERHAEISAVFAWRKSNAPRMARPVPRLDCEFLVWARRRGATCGRMGEFDSLVIDVPMPQAGVMASERICERGSGKAVHPCQKPLAVVLPFVERLPCATFLDPFAGLGTTGVACLKAGKRAVLIERDPKYWPYIGRRLEAAGTPLFPVIPVPAGSDREGRP